MKNLKGAVSVITVVIMVLMCFAIPVSAWEAPIAQYTGQDGKFVKMQIGESLRLNGLFHRSHFV